MHCAKKNLGAVVRKARKNRNLTQQQLADHLGMSLRSIIDVENGRSNLKFDTLFALVRFLSISGKDIFYPQEDTEINNEFDPTETRKKLLDQIEECSDRELLLLDGICVTALSVFRAQSFTIARDEKE